LTGRPTPHRRDRAGAGAAITDPAAGGRFRAGEIGAGSTGLTDYRTGEINAGAADEDADGDTQRPLDPFRGR
jgi:hypothetical protein